MVDHGSLKADLVDLLGDLVDLLMGGMAEE